MQNPLTIPGLVAFWDFQEPAGSRRVARGRSAWSLRENGGEVARADEGVFGPHAAQFDGNAWLSVPRGECGALDIHGVDAQVTVVAWIKRHRSSYSGCQAVAGIWNEHALRQYCLFLNLQIHDSAEQVGAHISSIGGATPGFKYCMDAAIGATPVPFDTWQCVAITYNGHQASAYLNGRLDSRGSRNPYEYPGGIFDGGLTGSDFTVGAVQRPESVDENFRSHGAITANPFHGLLGGLAIFDRAPDPLEIGALAE